MHEPESPENWVLEYHVFNRAYRATGSPDEAGRACPS